MRVRNLAGGEVREFTPPGLLTSFGEPYVAADGRVLLHEYRHMGQDRRPRQTIRLVRGSGRGRIIHRTRRNFGEARFCGDRPVLTTWAPRGGHIRVTVVEPPIEVFDGTERDLYGERSCDAHHWASLSEDGERAVVLDLPD